MLALLNAYVPKSYLLINECQQILKTPCQVYKNWLLREISSSPAEVNAMAQKAIGAFNDEEEKAEKELDVGLSNCVGLSKFNNRGIFGFIQVAKILSEKCKHFNPFKESLKLRVEAKFKFFERYLNYSTPNWITEEPDYFWKDVASCYEAYTAKDAADSTSFPALLNCLNHGLFVSKEKRAFKSKVTEKKQSYLEQIRDELKTIYEENVEDVKVAERYILSNIILSNKVPHSPIHPPVRELQSILRKILSTGMEDGDPEFYLLVLLLFWPEEKLQTGQDEDHEEPLQVQAWEEADINEEDTGEESEQQSPGLIFKLEQYVTLMEHAYDNIYGKYLQGRYLLPLFFLGKGSGLSRWIHKSRLDEVVECTVEPQLGNDPKRNKTKRRKINDMWKSGKAWRLQEIQTMLQPVQIKTIKMQQTGKEAEVVVCVGGKTITARRECKCSRSAVNSGHFYLAFNIRGPVVFKAGAQ
ncbi:hypothetical protein CRENBAI_015621 [Crenichthys baileyi]|uniref:Uncharacterized protein n=1 Tax=Crenichthys baileyi TaxID=28760 RepID=A0AAV9SS23_9TELE